MPIPPWPRSRPLLMNSDRNSNITTNAWESPLSRTMGKNEALVDKVSVARPDKHLALYSSVKLDLTPRNRSEEHTSELQSLRHLVCRLLLEKKKRTYLLYV